MTAGGYGAIGWQRHVTSKRVWTHRYLALQGGCLPFSLSVVAVWSPNGMRVLVLVVMLMKVVAVPECVEGTYGCA